MAARIWILVIGFLAALAALQFITPSSGLTYTRADGTRYVSYNAVVFWLLIVVTIVVCLLC
jgi:hypothetical protein